MILGGVVTCVLYDLCPKLHIVGGTGMARCGECGRQFNLLNTDEANEWFYGHDCEEV